MTTKTKRKLFWIAFGLLSIALRKYLSFYPSTVEQYYSRSFFLGVRWTFDALFGWLPFPWIYVFIPVIILIWIKKSRNLWKANLNWQEKTFRGGLGVLAFFFGLAGLFLWLWGFNYSRLSVEDQLSLDTQPLSLSELKEELDLETEKIIELRSRITPNQEDSIPVTEAFIPDDYQAQARLKVEEWLDENSFPTVGQVRGREIYPKGIFLRFSSSGLYFPFTGEGHVDAGVHPLQKPYIIAHEMFHGYGFGDEGTCNFNAYLACIRSEDPFIAYSGHLGYWRTLAINYLRYRPDEYREFRRSLPLTIQADLDAINEVLISYPDIMPRLRYYAYDTYLKAQGI